MRHDEKHAALAAYAFWCKLEQIGSNKYEMSSYYEQLFGHENSQNMCPACTVAVRRAEKSGTGTCAHCPCKWDVACCLYEGSIYYAWQKAPLQTRKRKKYAGDVASVMRRWCERVGVIAPREG